jgi:hypothetical protein
MFVSLNGGKIASFFLFVMVNITSANTNKGFVQLLSVDGLVKLKRVWLDRVLQRNKG